VSLTRAASVASRPGPAPWVAGAVLVWIPAVLVADRAASGSAQDLLGAGTWLLLLAVLRVQVALVRAQCVVVVAFAAGIEYTFSGWLHVYVYRLHDVPAFVPPGHGLVYLAALSISGTAVLRRQARTAVLATVLLGGSYAAWGLSPLAPRLDVLGAFWFCCLLAFLALGRSRLLYVGAFGVVTYLELLGTSLHIWTWAPHDPTGVVAMGNPPSGAAGGYGWFDLVAVAAAPALVGAASAARARVAGRRRQRTLGGEVSVGAAGVSVPESA
jgi:hypothetical protein